MRKLGRIVVYYLITCAICSTLTPLAYVFKPHIPQLDDSYSLYSKSPTIYLVMTGLNGHYIAESPAGYVFVHRYDFADKIGKEVFGNKYTAEVYASAYWSAQIVRDLNRTNVLLVSLALDDFNPIVAFFVRPICLALMPIILSLPKDYKYLLLLDGIRCYQPYVAKFPEWKEVSEEDWLKLCHHFERYTVEPWDNYEVLILEGALLLKLMPFISWLLPA